MSMDQIAGEALMLGAKDRAVLAGRFGRVLRGRFPFLLICPMKKLWRVLS